MKKKATVFLGSISAVIGLICLSGYGYLFKALVINLKKGPLTPSTDDVEKFPSHIVKNANPKQWKKSLRYNKLPLTENIIQELKKTRASSLLIIHNSKLVHEQYWKDKNPYSLTNSFSMAKAILSILVGFAIDDGYLESENQLVSDFLPEYKKK
ncbi:hypothetical protein ACFOEQ_05680 [Chryseobacterium arachidis]|uniref:hypothetical protein n=1 Tax=Chryseobacterium arachidis TaxID=1416778 RepID=UPI00360FEB53